MHPRNVRAFTAAAAILVIALTIPSARAAIDVSFGADVPVGDDGRLFFSISSRYFDRDPRVVEDYSRRYFRDPDDLAVALHLSRHCDRGMDFLVAMRREGLGWFEISNRCAVPAEVWFVPVKGDPGPPYGKAYGYWKKHRKNPSTRLVLSDADARNLVALRMTTEYYGVPVETAMQWRRENRDLRAVMTREYRVRHGKHAGPQQGRPEKAERGRGASAKEHGPKEKPSKH